MMISLKLNKAQKILDKIKNHIKRPRKALRRNVWENDGCDQQFEFAFNYKRKSFYNEEETLNDVNRIIEQKKQDYDAYWAIQEDKQKIRSAIYRKNMECGLHDILTQIDFLTMKRETLKRMVGTYNQAAFNVQDVTRITNKEITEIPINIYDKAEIEEIINELSRRINSLEEEKDVLNVTNSISVTLSQETMKLLGL